jgi:glycosyltransferase involved in cell wall biosynthesis/ADP-heptose:LPS heptosyltransferase
MENLENKLSQKGYWSEEQTLPVVGDTYYQKKVVDAWDFIEIDEPIQIRKDLMIQNIKQGKLFWNLNVALIFLADRIDPRSYLEVGVRTCGSLVPVLHNSNVKKVVGVDIWAGSYSGLPNTLEYTINQIKKYQAKTNKQFEIKFIKGNSHTKLKDLIKAGEKFDLITVDGDHSEAGAWEDLEDAVKLLGQQGVIVFDDIIHPSLLYLGKLVDRLKREHPEFSVLTNSRQDNGCAIFLKNIDVPGLLNGKSHGHFHCWCNGQLKDSVHPLYGQCQDCGTLVLRQQPTKKQLKEFYGFDGYRHNHQVNVSGYPAIEQRAANDFGDRIPVWYQLLRRCKPQLESLLEIGCAHGGFLSYCYERGVKNVVGVEPCEQTCKFARSRFNLPYVISGLFPDVSLPFENFDAVVGFDVVEHLLDPLSAMQKVADLLNDNGIYIFQTPCYRGEGHEWVQFRSNEHIFLYNSQSIRRLFSCAGLEVMEELPGYFPDDMFIIGRKKLIRNLLFVRTDSIGDNVLAASMLPYIRKKFERYRITVLCQDHIAELYECCPCVDNIIAFNRKRAYEDAGYRNEIINSLRALKLDLSLNSVFSREPLTDVFAIEAGAGSRVAFEGNLTNISSELRRKHNQFYTRLLTDDGKHKLELERHRDFLCGLGIYAQPLKPMVWITPDDENFAEEFFKKNGLEQGSTIALFAGAQRQVRLYDRYGEVLSEFCKRNRLKVVALGAEQERDSNQRNLDQIGVETINLCGRTTIRQSAAILRRCRLAVGAETGLAHICCAVGVPNVILLGGGHFGRFMPYSELTSVVCLPLDCFGCDWRCGHWSPHCVKDIAPEVFTEAVWQTFQKPSEKIRIFVQSASLWNPELGQPKWRMFERPPAAGDIEVITVDKGTASPQTRLDGRETTDALAQLKKNAAEDAHRRKYLVSAIVSTYNSEHFIRGCLEDLENQTIADRLEIIVVNSGSQQNEEAIIKEFQRKYDNIKYIRTDHRETIYRVWNRAIEAASGEYITNANTDDRRRKDALEIMSRALMASHDVALVYGDQIVTDTPNPTFENHHVVEMAKRPEFRRQRLLFGCCVGSQPMWRKSLHSEFGYFDESLMCAGDWDFWLRISQRYEFKHIPEFLGLYYYNPDGIEHGKKIHSLYERYVVGKRYGTPYISAIPLCEARGNLLVSVIMAAYNAADYITRAIESVLIQNYRNIELIIVNDGSTDRTADIVHGFKNEPIKYFFKENGGVASARNLGLRKSSGSFIVILDSDDMLTPDCIARHLQVFEQHPEADMVYCDDCNIDQEDKPISITNKPEYSDQNTLISDLFRWGWAILPFRTCIRKSVFDKIGFYDELLIVSEDYDMVRRFINHGLKMYHLPAALYLRRFTTSSLSKSLNAAKAKSHFDVVRKFMETFTAEQLFPDVRWDKLPAEQKLLLAKCKTAVVYLGIGEQYLGSNAPDFAEAAFEMACEQLEECCKIEPANPQVSYLLEKCRLIRATHLPSDRQLVCSLV